MSRPITALICQSLSLPVSHCLCVSFLCLCVCVCVCVCVCHSPPRPLPSPPYHQPLHVHNCSILSESHKASIRVLIRGPSEPLSSLSESSSRFFHSGWFLSKSFFESVLPESTSLSLSLCLPPPSRSRLGVVEPRQPEAERLPLAQPPAEEAHPPVEVLV